jgi:hypothetical protein
LAERRISYIGKAMPVTELILPAFLLAAYAKTF